MLVARVAEAWFLLVRESSALVISCSLARSPDTKHKHANVKRKQSPHIHLALFRFVVAIVTVCHNLLSPLSITLDAHILTLLAFFH